MAFYQQTSSILITLLMITCPSKLRAGEIINQAQAAQSIHQINIKKLPAIEASTPLEVKRRRFLKWLTPTTKNHVIFNYLPFNIGDNITHKELEKLNNRLSQLPYFTRVTITHQPSKYNREKLDLIISTKDAFPITISNILPFPKGPSCTLTHNNLLGLGHILHNQFFFNTRRGYGMQYDTPTSQGISTLGAQYYTHYGEKKVYKYSYSNIWIRKDFNIGKWEELQNSTLFVAGRYARTHFGNRPESAQNKNKIYHHHKFIVAELGTINSAYYKDLQVYALGEEENIPCGSSLYATIGYQIAEHINRPYVGISASKGLFIPYIGHCYSHIAYGSFLNKKKIEQGTLKINFGYFTPLFKTRFQYFRHFINVTYLKGYNRFKHEGLGLTAAKDPEEINERTEDPCSKGNTRLNVNLESVWFVPIMLYNFKTALLGFIDIVALQDKKQQLLNKNLCQVFGIGIRLQNKKKSFLNNIDIKLGYCPIMKQAIDIKIDTSVSLLHDYNRKEPGVIPYY